MIALIPAMAGGLVVAGVLAVLIGARPSLPPASRPSTRRGPRALLRRRDQTAIGVGLAIGAVGWLTTGWAIVVPLTPAVLIVLPKLVASSPSETRIHRLEAMEEWTRSLAGVLTVGVGLEEAILATLRSAPAPIAPEVTRLGARLQARWDTEHALRAFADELNDSTGDLIGADLILGARRRSTGVAQLLERLAESVADQVRAARQVEAERAKHRASARWVTIIGVGVLALLALTGNYIAPYRTPLGQLLLAVLLSAYVATLFWMKQMAAGQPEPRFLNTRAGTP